MYLSVEFDMKEISVTESVHVFRGTCLLTTVYSKKTLRYLHHTFTQCINNGCSKATKLEKK